MSYLKPNRNGRVYPADTPLINLMHHWMNQVKGSEVQIGEISHPDHDKELIDELMNLKWEFKPTFKNRSFKIDLEPPIIKSIYVNFPYDDGEVHLKTNRKRITLQFDWMEEVNYGTYFE